MNPHNTPPLIRHGGYICVGVGCVVWETYDPTLVDSSASARVDGDYDWSRLEINTKLGLQPSGVKSSNFPNLMQPGGFFFFLLSYVSLFLLLLRLLLHTALTCPLCPTLHQHINPNPNPLNITLTTKHNPNHITLTT